jgi:23S rRNA (cytosine1962-C5)-methyltransferase
MNEINQSRVQNAISARLGLEVKTNVYRLFNGFYEGLPGIVLDRYDQTLVILDHNSDLLAIEDYNILAELAHQMVPQIKTVLLKQRQHPDDQHKRGILLYGSQLTASISENGVSYALDLRMNQDASFYLDTRNLRSWLRENMAGLRVLNTFAYTGSLGVAAGAGAASEVIQTDINHRFLNIANKSWSQAGLEKEHHTTITGDFFRVVGRLRHQNKLFDCVILDPPFFSQTSAGRVDLQKESTRLINKIRPLIAHKGYLVVINNALFLDGVSFKSELDDLCQSEYLQFEKIIPVPDDITGYPSTIQDHPPVDPSPFNHPTKIAILSVFRKDERK